MAASGSIKSQLDEWKSKLELAQSEIARLNEIMKHASVEDQIAAIEVKRLAEDENKYKHDFVIWGLPDNFTLSRFNIRSETIIGDSIYRKFPHDIIIYKEENGKYIPIVKWWRTLYCLYGDNLYMVHETDESIIEKRDSNKSFYESTRSALIKAKEDLSDYKDKKRYCKYDIEDFRNRISEKEEKLEKIKIKVEKYRKQVFKYESKIDDTDDFDE